MPALIILDFLITPRAKTNPPPQAFRIEFPPNYHRGEQAHSSVIIPASFITLKNVYTPSKVPIIPRYSS